MRERDEAEAKRKAGRPPPRCLCPVCWNSDTMYAREKQIEALHDDPALMGWSPPRGGIRAASIEREDIGGMWTCLRCRFTATPHEVGVLLDAALWASRPTCDSIVDGVHQDVRTAQNGGR